MDLKPRGRAPIARAGLALALQACGPGAPSPAAAGAPWTPERLVERAGFDPERLFPFATGMYRHDPAAGLLLAPDHRERWEWPEHPEGHLVIRTNNLGLLEEGPTAPGKTRARVLVAGDSHLMVVNASESFPNVLEALLAAAGTEVEVLSSGVGYTGPSLHLRRLERFLALEPDAFVSTVFSGNDFLDELTLAYDVSAGPQPPLDRSYWDRLGRADRDWRGPLYQGLNQAHFFAHWPGTEELALTRVLAALEETRALCAARGIRFLVVVLPTKLDVDRDDPEGRSGALAALALSEEQAGVNARLAARLVRALAERGVACLDLTSTLRASPEPCYWRADHHLSRTGHARAARALFEARSRFLDEVQEVSR